MGSGCDCPRRAAAVHPHGKTFRAVGGVSSSIFFASFVVPDRRVHAVDAVLALRITWHVSAARRTGRIAREELCGAGAAMTRDPSRVPMAWPVYGSATS